MAIQSICDNTFVVPNAINIFSKQFAAQKQSAICAKIREVIFVVGVYAFLVSNTMIIANSVTLCKPICEFPVFNKNHENTALDEVNKIKM